MSISIGKFFVLACCLSSAFAGETVLLQENFESQTPGMKPKKWLRHTWKRPITDRFEITNEDSVSGDNALKFARTDCAFGWQAEIRMKPVPPNTGGRVNFSFHILLQGQASSTSHRFKIFRSGISTPEFISIWMSSSGIAVTYHAAKKTIRFPEISVQPNRWYRFSLSIPLTPENGKTLQAELTDTASKKTQKAETEWLSFSDKNERYHIFWDFMKSMRQATVFLDDIKFSLVTPETTVIESGSYQSIHIIPPDISGGPSAEPPV